MTLRTLTQYNSTTDSVSTSVRFNWIYFPGSDLYVAYDELRADLPGVRLVAEPPAGDQDDLPLVAVDGGRFDIPLTATASSLRHGLTRSG